jgi:hypothetical protein
MEIVKNVSVSSSWSHPLPQVLYLVLADYQVYTYPLTGRQEHLTLLPESCCVNSIAVYSELGSVKLLASHVSTFDLLHRFCGLCFL